MKSVFYSLILVTFLPVCLLAQSPSNKSKPNIIFILADDLGYGDLGCYGQQKIETPNIDKLAVEGLKFTQFYAGSTVCAPSRASFLTGLHTGHTAVRGNIGTKPEGQFPLPQSSISFASILEDHGYETGAFGKWGLGYITTTGAPDKKGFETFYGYNCQSLAHNYYPDHLWYNHNRIDFPENLEGNKTYSADLIQQNAIRFINENYSKPFLLYVPYTLPHAEVIAPHDSNYYYYIKKFNEKPDTTRRRYDGRFLEPYPHAMFAAMVARLDRYVGEVIKAVQEKGIADNTLIIFTSDNGPHKEGGGNPDFFNSNGIYRGIKRDLYEGGIRVPFIAYLPRKIKPGTSDYVGAFWDMFPTFLELAGIKNYPKSDGISVLPALFGKKQREHEFLYWEFHEQHGKQAVRMRNWKGIKLDVSDADKPIELYDLENDPGEKTNVAAQHPDVVKRIQVIISNAHVQDKNWPLLKVEKEK